MSAADLAAVLLAGHLRYDFKHPENANNDHLILSKGHAAPLLYAVYKAAGAISDDELMSLRKLGSRLEGHPTPALPWVDVATGSLGQGLPIGVGIALAGKKLEHLPYRVWVILGDSEMAEGSVWEAMARASDEKLGNLIAIVDVNRLGQRGPTALQWHTEIYEARAKAFGWNAIVVDGHNLEEIDAAYSQAEQGGDVPTMIIAKTKKGAGVVAGRGPGQLARQGAPEGRRREGDRGAWRGAQPDRDARRRRRPTASRRRRGAASTSSFRPGRSARSWRPGRRSATRSRRSAPPATTWSSSTPRSATRPSPRSSRRTSRSASSRPTSPSSRWSRRRSG